MTDSATTLQDVGSGKKKTLAILGDGFAAGTDQTTYNNYVRDNVMKGVFQSDAFNEDSHAWNVIRVNLESANSPASTRTWNLMGTPNNLADDTFTDNIVATALNIISNGEWWHGWFEDGTDTQSRIDAAIRKWAPGADFIFIVVNSTLPGGLRSGNILKVTTQESAATIAHEFGHGFGNLGDEYSTSGKGAYSGTEPQRVNLTIETSRSKIKWKQYIDPGTPIPTGTGNDAGYNAGTKPATWDDQADAGAKTAERVHEIALAANSRAGLAQAEHALEQLEAGTYGICENCGNPIGKLRLQARPRATLCMTCQEKQARH